jgi:WD40 repeat protein
MRALLSLAILVLTCGCNRPAAGPGGPSPTLPGPGAAAVAATSTVLSADLPKLKPRAKFNLPGERSGSDIGGLFQPLQLSADGQRLAISYRTPKSETFVQVWQLTGAPKMIAEFKGGSFALSPSGKLLLVADVFKQEVYDIESKKAIANLSGFMSHAFFPDDKTLVSTQRSGMFANATKGKITIWNIAANADGGSFEVPDDRFNNALPAKNGKEFWLFMSHEKFEVECYDLDAKKLARTIKPEPEDPKQPYTSAGIWASISPDSSAFAADVAALRFYDAESGKNLGGLPSDLWAAPAGLVPGNGRYLARPGGEPAKAVGFGPTDLIIYDWKQRKALAALTGHSADEDGPSAAGSGDGKVVVSVTKKGEVLVFDVSSVK